MMLWSTSIAYLWTFESAIVFQNRRTQFVLGRLELPSDGLIKLRTNDGISLDALALTHEDGSGYWILFCQPSGGTLHGGGDPRSLHAAGYNVFAFDYRGFGRNRGTPSESGLYEDALTAYRHLRDQLAVPSDRIILAGRSLGSAVAVELATRVPSGGLLILSAIDSVPAIGSRLYFWAPVSLLASEGFDSIAKAPLVKVPVIAVHATDDSFVPISVARALFQRFPARKEMLEFSGGHNDVGIPVGGSFKKALTRSWPVSIEK
jgi:fermentation-respiration switch protein FrsA (DUF1100 family)